MLPYNLDQDGTKQRRPLRIRFCVPELEFSRTSIALREARVSEWQAAFLLPEDAVFIFQRLITNLYNLMRIQTLLVISR
jgi:hypothetical protein